MKSKAFLIGLFISGAILSLSFLILRQFYIQRLNSIPMEDLARSSDVVSTLNRRLSEGGDPNAVTDDGVPIIFLAISAKRNSKAVQSLLEHGASVDVRNQEGHSPYMAAVILDNKPALELLFQHRGVPSREELDMLIIAASDSSIRSYLESHR